MAPNYEQKEEVRVAVVMTCHNRRETTMACLKALFSNMLPDRVKMQVVLIDDGSIDGTGDAVQRLYPSVVMERGDGSLFWNRGMHRAQAIAVGLDPDFILWLNDDTILEEHAIARLLTSFRELTSEVRKPVIVVGATVDPATDRLSYGGLRTESDLRPFKYAHVWSPDRALECEAMNGNIVLVPKSIYSNLVNLDPVFEHALGDIDYALRARSAGFGIFVAAGYLGSCASNKAAGVYNRKQLSFRARWKAFTGKKGLPPKSWLHFTRRHGGFAWLFYFFVPYIKFAMRSMIPAK